jgi:hypothetical protein
MIRAICFDIGETLVDETRHWSAIAAESGVPTLTLLGVLGGVAARGDHHTRVFTIVGIEPIDGPDYESIDHPQVGGRRHGDQVTLYAPRSTVLRVGQRSIQLALECVWTTKCS